MAARGLNVDDNNFAKVTGYGGTDAPKCNPQAMSGFIDAGLKVLENAKKIPKGLLKQCAGIVLLSAEEGGFFVSAQGGSGVALSHRDGKWSNPIAVNMISVGAGAVFGYAEKSVIVLLNHFAMKKLLEGEGSLNVGVDAGFAVGKCGRSAAGDIALSSKGGLGTSFVYTFQKGVLFSVEAVIGGRLTPPSQPHEKFYGTDNHADILEGKVQAPEGSNVPALLEKLADLESGEDVEQ